jgi:hypothetical protein
VAGDEAMTGDGGDDFEQTTQPSTRAIRQNKRANLRFMIAPTPQREASLDGCIRLKHEGGACWEITKV